MEIRRSSRAVWNFSTSALWARLPDIFDSRAVPTIMRGLMAKKKMVMTLRKTRKETTPMRRGASAMSGESLRPALGAPGGSGAWSSRPS